MFKRTKTSLFTLGALVAVGTLLIADPAFATPAPGGNNFSTIAGKIGTSISALPGLISGVAYLIGVLLAVLGVMKLKDHVENPTNTPLKDAVIRLIAGGMLFAIGFLMEVMLNTVGDGSATVGAVKLKGVTFGVSTP